MGRSNSSGDVLHLGPVPAFKSVDLIIGVVYISSLIRWLFLTRKKTIS